MANLRPRTNLVVPENLQLDKKALDQGFFYVYRKKYPGAEISFLTRLWACSFLPEVGNDPKFGTMRKGVQQAAKYARATPAGYLSVKKIMGTNPYFRVSVPLFSFNKLNEQSLEILSNYFLGIGLTADQPQSISESHAENLVNLVSRLKTDAANVPTDISVSGEKAISAISRLDARTTVELRKCLELVRIQTKGNLAVVFADFKITKEEAQQMTSTHWIELRDIDLYPMLLQWVVSGFGAKGDAPTVSFPISKIAATLPKGSSQYARINEHGLAINEKGRPVYLPKELNNTLIYEDRYSQAGSRDDGSYSLVDINEGAMAMEVGKDVKVRLPPNLVVLIDWINSKYSYTNTRGILEVMDLSRHKVADVAHIRNLMEERILTDKTLNAMIALGVPAGVPAAAFRIKDTDFPPEITSRSTQEALATDDVSEWYGKALSMFYRREGKEVATYSDISTEGFPPFRPIARYLKAIKEAVLNNLDAVYERYSVEFVMDNLAWLIMIVEYAPKFEEIKAEDLTLRAAAINQKVTKGWKPPPIPLLSKRIGMLPHQIKVRNLLKDSPDLAILPVQAGGGKSLLLITDILYEIANNRSEPYLILCPGHLVANYVKEIVFFTDGKLNVIAINSYVIRQNGFDRLQAMLEKAPRNTVVVCDYDVLRRRQQTMCYGTTPVTVYPVIDFLQQFGFNYAGLDESHKVKNDTARTKATMTLINDIKKKRLASGTMAHDSASDLALQVATLDPTLFGTREEFNKKYGEDVSGNRVLSWAPGAERLIMNKIKSRIVVAGAMRKEWAALLPPKTEWIKGVNLTQAQYNVYNDILDGILDRIKEDAKSNSAKGKSLRKFLEGTEEAKTVDPEDNSEDSEDDSDDSLDSDDTEGLAALLKPYLARLEQFMVAPASDPLGDKVLKGDDRISPKALEIIKRIQLHIDKGYAGKVLIFTNYVESAEEIYRVAGEKLQAAGILYKATNKDIDGDRFERDPKIKWMVGVEQSMNEGLNFQFASRLIRCETVWNPGTLEQGDSRINRPELKKEENRNEIFYDWILVNNSIDITKMARLISKVVAIAKFENTDNPEYQAIPDVPVIKMNLANIKAMNSWEENLGEYNDAYAQFRITRQQEYAEYKEQYRAEHNGEDPKLEPLAVAPAPPDAKLMSRVPYPAGLNIYGSAEAGLVRLDEFVRKPENQLDDEDENAEDGEDSIEEQQKALYQSMKGMLVHTEYGDGILHSMNNAKRVPVDLFSGYTVFLRKSAVFICTRTETSTKDIRNELLKKIGELPVDTPVDVPATSWKASTRALKLVEKVKKEKRTKKILKENKKQQEFMESLNGELQITLTNGYLAITYFVDGEDDSVGRALQASGFRPDPVFYYARMPTAARLKRQLDLWQQKGFRPDPSIMKAGAREGFRELYNLLKGQKVLSHNDTYKLTTATNIRNFYRLEHKASNDKHLYKPYPLIEDGMAYIALPAGGQTATTAALKVLAPNVKFYKSKPSLSFFGSVQQVEAKLAHLSEAGVTISNLATINKELRKLKKMNVRTDKDGKGLL